MSKKRRSIAPEIRLSQSFARLTLRQRDLWHGLIAVADDQGRLPGLPAAIRAMVWPYDDILLSEVQKDIDALANQEQSKIIVYSVENNTFIQIIHWWEYQNPQWATYSKYPPPEGWLDRVRITGPKRKVITENWFTPGGFFITAEHDETNKGDDNVKVKVNPLNKADDKGGYKGGKQPPQNQFPPSATFLQESIQEREARRLLEGVCGILTGGATAYYNTVEDMILKYGYDKTLEGITKAREKWIKTPRQNGNGYYSPTNYGFIDWAVAHLEGHSPWGAAELSPVEKTLADIQRRANG